MYKVKRFNKITEGSLSSQKDKGDVREEAKKLVSSVNKKYGKTMTILSNF